ncbi:MAG: hypothetical protein A07HB70_01686 [uncultured archaeon A07HB70]|jgi:hypothetical protein|nr:MAG: hypothetical protein A07HB70_01686 [uncultured archaeon A07HB70]
MEYEIGSDERVSTAVVRAVSAVEGLERAAIRPLEDVVDPAALDRLFGRQKDGTCRTGGRVSFVYSQHWVTVESGEYLQLRSVRSGLGEDRPETAAPDVR